LEPSRVSLDIVAPDTALTANGLVSDFAEHFCWAILPAGFD
jgi:hypothetical protein